MYDLSRLRGVVIALLVVAGGLASLSAASLAMVGGRPGWLARGDSTIEGGQDKIVGSRIAGAAAWAATQPVDRPDLGVILGASAVGMGIDPIHLEAEAGPNLPARWLSLYANGANLADLRDLSESLFTSGLRPRLLVLGIHPGLLARSDDYLTDRLQIETAAVRRELASWHPIGAKLELEELAAVPLNWAFPNRTRISNQIRGWTNTIKRRGFARFGVGVSGLYRAETDPWTVRLLIEDANEPVREAAAENRTVNAHNQPVGAERDGPFGPVKDKGWFNSASYDRDGDNPRALIEIIREARAREIETVVLLLPESNWLRAQLPAPAMQVLHTSLDQGFGSNAPLVIDLRAALADNQFHDSIHPNKAGRDLTTSLLIRQLRDRLAIKP